MEPISLPPTLSNLEDHGTAAFVCFDPVEWPFSEKERNRVLVYQWRYYKGRLLCEPFFRPSFSIMQSVGIPPPTVAHLCIKIKHVQEADNQNIL